MQNDISSRTKWNIIFFGIVLLAIAADQLSKYWVRSNLYPGQSMPADGFFRLLFVQNTGAAFSMFYGNNGILTIVSIVGTVMLLLYYFFVRGHYPLLETRLNTISVAMILGGTMGDLIDRIHLGRVTDFISIGPFAIFNIADSCIVMGVILLALSILISSRSNVLEHHQ